MRNTYQTDEAVTAALNTSQLKRLAKYLRPYMKYIILTITLMFTATMIELIGPYFIQIAIDEYVPNGNFRGILIMSIVYVIAIGIGYITTRYKIAIANRVGQLALLDLRRDVFNHTQTLSYNYFSNNPAGKIMTRIVNDINSLNRLFTNGIVNVITEMSMLVVAAVLMFAIHPQLAAVTLTTVPLFMVLIFLTRNAIRREWRQVRRKLSNLNAYIHENIAGIRVIQAYVRQNENIRIFRGVLDDVFTSWMRAIRINSAFHPSIELISTIGNIIIFWYGARLLQIDGVKIGVLISFTIYLRRFWHPVIMLSNFYNQLLVAMASSERIFELLDTKAEIVNEPEARSLTNVKGKVEFKNINFSYDGKKQVLKDINFTVKPGETIAIVGPTGSGKTTIINLLARFYDPNEGQVLIDNQDIKYVTLESLRENIGIMLQDPFIFSGTIMDNIRYSKPGATEEEVRDVAKAVYAHDFITKMENGYYTDVQKEVHAYR